MHTHVPACTDSSCVLQIPEVGSFSNQGVLLQGSPILGEYCSTSIHPNNGVHSIAGGDATDACSCLHLGLSFCNQDHGAFLQLMPEVVDFLQLLAGKSIWRSHLSLPASSSASIPSADQTRSIHLCQFRARTLVSLRQLQQLLGCLTFWLHSPVWVTCTFSTG